MTDNTNNKWTEYSYDSLGRKTREHALIDYRDLPTSNVTSTPIQDSVVEGQNKGGQNKGVRAE